MTSHIMERRSLKGFDRKLSYIRAAPKRPFTNDSGQLFEGQRMHGRYETVITGQFIEYNYVHMLRLRTVDCGDITIVSRRFTDTDPVHVF